ncbi:MAG: VTT domain-containing protein [Dehalococcoidia bacterium]|nr:VTT domain-containing protein [Dehalococcoidia bacterium]
MSEGIAPGEEAARPRRGGWRLILLSALLIIAIGILAVVFREDLKSIVDNIERYEKYTYIIAFVVNFMAGATVIVYVPGVPTVFALGGIVQFPFAVGIVAGLGEALGGFTGYLLGRGGESYLKEPQTNGRIQRAFQKIYSRIDGWMGKRGYVTVFLASAVFNPFYMLFGATAGATRMAPWKYYLASAAGKIVKGTYVAYLGHWGMGYVLEWLHISTT